MDNKKLEEALAQYAHETWSRWMKYMLSTEGVVLTAGANLRWKRQMETPYTELPEEEKESDREEARRMIAIFENLETQSQTIEANNIINKKLNEDLKKSYIHERPKPVSRPPQNREVDRTKVELTTGEPVPKDYSHTEIEPETGMQKGYIVLSDEERSKGFVRPVRSTYTHKKCGGNTTMGRKLAETYARDPEFYTGTFCAICGSHYSLTEFVWEGTGIQVGT